MPIQFAPSDVDRPPEHQVQHEREREQVHAGDQDRPHRERGGVERVRAVVESQPQVLGHGADLRSVVEGHHHEAEEDHRRHRADPVEVHGRDAVLRAVRGLPQDLEGAEVRRDERQPG